jgi:glycerol uptake facilitator-like aquaporin
MKILPILIYILAVSLFAPQILQAQETTYLSNLGQLPVSSNPVGSDSWYGADFYTGTNGDGYILDSIQLAMTDATGNPSDFTVMLYSATGVAGIYPGNSLGTLTGSLNPTPASTYTYAPAPSLSLSPSTEYFIVLTAGTAIAEGAYNWNYVGTYNYTQNGSWNTDADIFYSNNGGSTWNALASSGFGDAQFAITATAIPEPGVMWLLGICISILYRWTKRPNTSLEPTPTAP